MAIKQLEETQIATSGTWTQTAHSFHFDDKRFPKAIIENMSSKY